MPIVKPEETITPPSTFTPPVDVFKFDKQTCKDKLAAVVDHLNSFTGKKNHNPFLYIGKKIAPLIARLHNGEETKELQDTIMALQKEAPVINPDEVITPSTNKVDEASAGPRVEAPKLSPTGLNLPPK